MIADKSDQGETDHNKGDPLAGCADLFRIASLQVMPFAQLSLAVPGPALRAMPGFPAAACPENGRVGQGCGPDPLRSRIAALGEAVELASCCAWGDEALIRARASDLGPQAVPPDRLHGFSPRQIRRRGAWNRRYSRYDWRPGDAAGDIDWIAANDAQDGATVLLPADLVLIGRTESESAAGRAGSSGCAAGPTPEAARAAALLEGIERDAAGRWWYGRRKRPVLAPSLVAPDLAAWLQGRARQTWLLDITTDIGIPVVAALSRDGSGGTPALGFAARTALADAASAALAEMLGVETALPPWRDVSGDGMMQEWLARGPGALPPIGQTGPARPDVPDDALTACLGALERLGLRALFIDLTRPVFGVPVFRAVVPGLCHDRPRFGIPRLLVPDPSDLSRPAARPNPVPLLV